jgi:hypothetical protein
MALSQLSDAEKTSELPVPLHESKGPGEFASSKGYYGYYSKR